MRSGGWIEWLVLASVMRGFGSAIRLMCVCPIANAVLLTHVRAYERSEQTQEIRDNAVTRAVAYVRSGPPSPV